MRRPKMTSSLHSVDSPVNKRYIHLYPAAVERANHDYENDTVVHCPHVLVVLDMADARVGIRKEDPGD